MWKNFVYSFYFVTPNKIKKYFIVPNKMNIPQYLTIKQANLNKNYLQDNTPVVLESQIHALYNALNRYLNSDCVNQKAKQIDDAKKLLVDKNKGSRLFVHNLLYSVVFEYLALVLPVNGKYQYDAGTCKGACGYGTNRVVALLGNALIETNIALQDIQNFPQQMLIEFWTAFKSLTLAQVQGTGINYNFKGKVCNVNNAARNTAHAPVKENYQLIDQVGASTQCDNCHNHPDNMFAGNIRI
jgi:hypothetical protein